MQGWVTQSQADRWEFELEVIEKLARMPKYRHFKLYGVEFGEN